MNAEIQGGLTLAVSLVILGAVWALHRLGRLRGNANFVAAAPARSCELEGRRLAGFGRRASAWIVDFALVALVTLAVELALASREAPVVVRFSPANSLLDIALVVAYFGIVTYVGKGQTPGKRLMKIRVVSLAHENLSLWHSIERALGYAASALEAGFGFWQYYVHPNRQTVHDRIAETIVVDLRPFPEPIATQEKGPA